MKYDFTTVVSRKNTGAMKWDEISTSTGEKPDVVPLSVADMEFKACPEIVEGIKAAAERGVFGYTYCPPGYMESVTEWMEKRHHWTIEPEWVDQTWGVILALYNAIRSLTKEGDGVLVQTPVYYPFFGAITDTNRRIVESPLKLVDGKYEMDYEDLREKAKDAKLMLLCSPHNPVGRVWTREELVKLGEICLENDVIVVADEIHFDIIMPGYEHTVFAAADPRFADHCVVCTSPSKTFNLAGLNLANIIIKNKEMRDAFRKECLSTATDYNTFFGYAACEAGYRYGGQWLDEMIQTVESNYQVLKRFMAEHFPQVTVYELQGTYLAWMDWHYLGMEPKELERFMTDEAWLFLDQGYMFGKPGEGYARINLACPESVLTEALERLDRAVRRRK